jgi:hypothetical protein
MLVKAKDNTTVIDFPKEGGYPKFAQNNAVAQKIFQGLRTGGIRVPSDKLNDFGGRVSIELPSEANWNKQRDTFLKAFEEIYYPQFLERAGFLIEKDQ